MSRLDYLAGRAERTTRKGPTVAEALDLAGLTLLRIRAHWDRNGRIWHDVHGYTAAFVRLTFEPEVQADLFIWAMAEFPGINWIKDHDVHLTHGCIHAAPDAYELGGDPAEDRTFGGTAPVYARPLIPAQRSEAAA